MNIIYRPRERREEELKVAFRKMLAEGDFHLPPAEMAALREVVDSWGRPKKEIVVECPCCGAEKEDFDGFGVIFCDVCEYCKHPSYTGGVCDICGVAEED